MKHFFKTSLIIFGIALMTLFACKKDNETDPLSGPTNMKEFFSENEPANQRFTVNSSTGGSITGSKGTEITIPPNAFKKADGTPVTGNVTIELKELFEKSEMILSDKPTVSYGQILVSGGEFYISASQNGEELRLNNTSLSVSTPTDSIDYNMNLFTGVSTDTGFSWIPANQGTNPDTMRFQTSFPYSYLYEIDSLGWINCDYFYFDPKPKYDLNVNFSSRPNDVAVYFVFNQINSVARAYDWDNNLEFEGLQIPQGQSITVVAIGVDSNGKYYMASEDITISGNTTATLSMIEVTKNALMSMLNNL